MTGTKSTPLPLIAMLMVYMLVVALAAGYFFLGLMWGSEVYRDRGMPLIEWVKVAGPLVATIATMSATIVFWNKGRRRVSYTLFAAVMIAVLAVLTLFRAPAL